MKKNIWIILIIISAMLFGSYGVWSKLIWDSFWVFYQWRSRALIIVVMLLPFLIWRKEFIKIPKTDWKWLSIFLWFTAFTQAPIFYAFNNMDIGSATLLFFVSMLLTMNIVGLLFLWEKLTKIKAISLILAIIGMYIVFSFSLTYFALFAGLMAMLNGIASWWETSSSKKLTWNYSTLYITWLSWVVIILTNAPISFFLWEVQHIPSFDIVWVYQIGYTFASLWAFWLVIEGLKSVEAGVWGLLGLMEIVFSIALGIIIFNEELTFRVTVWGVLIIIASALPYVHESIKKKSTL